MASSEQSRQVQMWFHDGIFPRGETLMSTPAGPNLHRMEESSILGEASYQDVVETDLRADGSLRFLRVITASGLKTAAWILSQTLIESSGLSALLDGVMAVGGPDAAGHFGQDAQADTDGANQSADSRQSVGKPHDARRARGAADFERQRRAVRYFI